MRSLGHVGTGADRDHCEGVPVGGRPKDIIPVPGPVVAGGKPVWVRAGAGGRDARGWMKGPEGTKAHLHDSKKAWFLVSFLCAYFWVQNTRRGQKALTKCAFYSRSVCV